MRRKRGHALICRPPCWDTTHSSAQGNRWVRDARMVLVEIFVLCTCLLQKAGVRFPPMIEFSHVFKSYGRGVNALADASFHVEAGEFVFVAGPSGAGKSTLLKLVAGLIPPTRGKIQVNGQDLVKLTPRARPYLRRAVGVILQNTHLLNDRSAFENVLMPLIVTGHDHITSTARARAAIEKVGLAGKESRRPIELSGGDQQRLAIARAIVNRP